MSMLNTDPTPLDLNPVEAEHLAAIDVTYVAKTIAMSALRVAHSDLEAAFHQLREGTSDEAIKIITEGLEQLEFARNILSGRTWQLVL